MISISQTEYVRKGDIVLDRIFGRVRVIQSVDAHIGNFVNYDFPLCVYFDFAVRSRRNFGYLLGIIAVRKPAYKGIPSSRRSGEGDGFVLYRIIGGVSGSVHAAVKVIGDRISDRLPVGGKSYVVGGDFVEYERFALLGQPAVEAVTVPRGISGRGYRGIVLLRNRRDSASARGVERYRIAVYGIIGVKRHIPEGACGNRGNGCASKVGSSVPRNKGIARLCRRGKIERAFDGIDVGVQTVLAAVQYISDIVFDRSPFRVQREIDVGHGAEHVFRQ